MKLKECKDLSQVFEKWDVLNYCPMFIWLFLWLIVAFIRVITISLITGFIPYRYWPHKFLNYISFNQPNGDIYS